MRKFLILASILTLGFTNVVFAEDIYLNEDNNTFYVEAYEPYSSDYIDMYSYGITSPSKGVLVLDASLSATLPSYKCEIVGYLLDGDGDIADTHRTSKTGTTTMYYDTDGVSGEYYRARFTFNVLSSSGNVLDSRTFTTNAIKCK